MHNVLLPLPPGFSLEAVLAGDHTEKSEGGQDRLFLTVPCAACVLIPAGVTTAHWACAPLSTPNPNKYAFSGMDLPDNHKPAVIKALQSVITDLKRQQQPSIPLNTQLKPKRMDHIRACMLVI